MRAESSLQSLRHGLKPEMIDEFEEDSLNSTSLSPIALSTIKLRTDTTTSSLREECFEMILAKLKGQLVSQITLVTPDRRRSREFLDQLKTYRYEYKKRGFGTGFGQQEQLVREVQGLLQTLLTLWKSFLSQSKREFYLLLPNGNAMYFFYSHEDTHKGQKHNIVSKDKQNHKALPNTPKLTVKLKRNSKVSYEPPMTAYLLISSKSNLLAQTLQREEIQFTSLQPDSSQYEKEKLLLCNRQIPVFFGYAVNNLLLDTQFQIAANFPFLNSLQVLPFELYNGKEQSTEHDYLAQESYDLLGQKRKCTYRLKFTGLWFPSSLASLNQRLSKEKRPFYLTPETLPSTRTFSSWNTL